MAKIDEITVDVNVKMVIPEETIYRCLRIMEIWMDDNPDKNLVVDTLLSDDGRCE